MNRVDAGALALAAWAGASAWISLGTIAVVDQSAARIGALPSLPWLFVLVAAGILGAWVLRLRTCDSWPLSLTALLWLPWLPWTFASALVWEGRLEWAIWMVALGGVLFARARVMFRAPPSWWSDAQRAPWLAAALFFVCSIAAGARLQYYIPGGDEPHYLIITQSLLYDGDLKIENNHERGDFFEYIETPVRPDFLRRGTDGQIYSVHAPGVSALLAPAYAIAGYPGALIFVSLLTALAVAALWRTAFLLTQDPSAAWAATGAVGFGATYFLPSFTIFPDPVGAAAVTVALAVLITLETTVTAVSARHLVAAGAALALLPWLHTRFVLIAAIFGILIGLRLWPRLSQIVAFAVVPLVSALAWFGFFFWIYGTPNPAAPYGDSRQNAFEWVPAGLAGLAVDQQFGLLANAPVLACAALGFIGLWRTRRRLAIELVAIAIPYVLVVSSFGMWWGGWSAPARFLTCLMPLAVPFMAVAWVEAGLAWRCLFVALGSVGTVNVLARVTVEQGALLYNFRDGFDLLLDWASRTINLPLAFPSIHRLGTEPTLLLGSIWLIAGGLALMALSFTLNRRRLTAGASWAITSWILAACAMAAMTASWRASRTQPMTAESSKIDFVHRWNPDRRPLTLHLGPWRLIPAETALGEIELGRLERRRDVGDRRSLLFLGRVPAGRYELVIEAPAALHGTLSVSVGATSQTIEEWALDGKQGGTFQLRLPTLVHSLTIREDERGNGVITRIGLRPLDVLGTEESRRYAVRGARYGRVRAFFLDDSIYMEPGGAWTRGDSSAEMVVVPDEATAVDVDVTAGPVAATLEISTGSTSELVTLSVGERRRMRLPAGLWRVTTSGRFRPKDYDGGSRDARSLGARIEFP